MASRVAWYMAPTAWDLAAAPDKRPLVRAAGQREGGRLADACHAAARLRLDVTGWGMAAKIMVERASTQVIRMTLTADARTTRNLGYRLAALGL